MTGLALLLTACSSGSTAQEPAANTPDVTADGAGGDTVTLVTHGSWAASDEVLAAFEAQTGLTLQVIPVGDAATLTNQLVLTKDSPLGDVVFGIDNTFASRAIDAGVLESYSPAALPASMKQYVLADGALTPVDVGDVCINIDVPWFADHGLREPENFADLINPDYRDLTVVLNPASSSPGLAFLLATVGYFGDRATNETPSNDPMRWQDYWAMLRDNGVTVADSWDDGYYTEFSGAGEGGTKPIVVSYSSSPAYTVTEDASATTTKALLDTCFRQVEYAGVLAGAKNPDGAHALIDFLTSATFQADIPGQMYVYPADSAAPLPEEWAEFAPLAEEPFTVDPARIDANRDRWINEWTEIMVG
jgi:thiamine transport system substrate-binding protein